MAKTLTKPKTLTKTKLPAKEPADVSPAFTRRETLVTLLLIFLLGAVFGVMGGWFWHAGALADAKADLIMTLPASIQAK